MGSSVSRQEELFLHRQWPELLEAAMQADMEVLQLHSSNHTNSPADGEHVNNSNATPPSSVSHAKNKRGKKKDEFCMSFQEWQAFLSVLEQKEPSSAPSDIAARLTTTQLHVPVATLMVHVCAWFRGAISTKLLTERVDLLLNLVHTIQEKSSDDGASLPAEEDAHAAVDNDHDGANRAPTSRRARFTNFVQKKVVDRARRRPGSAAPADAADEDNTLLLLDTFDDLTCLVQELLNAATLHATDIAVDREKEEEDGARTAASAQKRAREVLDLYDEKIHQPDALEQHPVIAVAMVIVLAVYSAKAASHPELALRSVTHLQALQQLMFKSSNNSNGVGTSSSNQNSRKADLPAAASTATQLVELWPLIRALEVALVHRQHEADVVGCLSDAGAALTTTLQHMRTKRENLEKAAAAADTGATPPLTASERWAAGSSQYIGQRPIWSQLRSHFLSAGVFEADKPTVLVFFGPSGYGKSELAKRVASVLHNCSMAELEASGKMVYIHMPSFCTKDSIYSLVDPPAAHVGSGILLSALQKHPDAVVVLDEFEKSTAESINNLWLSAFQKNGVLRSLKEASRSVSTVHTTFILTCNIAAESITRREELYLGASATDQETIRNLFITQCKEVCRETMGDPFVNRVDYFCPFMPYTAEERRQYVCLLLERLLASQARKGRHLYVTPGFVAAMVARLRTFHAATLEEAVRSQVMHMAQAGWAAAVLTVERRISGEVIVLLPTTLRTSPDVEGNPPAVAEEQGGGGMDGSSLLVEAWDSLPGGAAALQRWRREELPPTVAAGTTQPFVSASPPPAPASAAEKTTTVPSHTESTVSRAAAQPATQARRSDSPILEMEYEHVYATDTAKVMELEKELEKTRELVKQRDLEIVTLKEKVLLLQKALAVVVLALLSCLCLLAVVIGLKLTLLFAFSMLGVVVLVLGVPLALLVEAVRALFRVLGPFKGGVLVLVVSMWMARSYRSLVTCS